MLNLINISSGTFKTLIMILFKTHPPKFPFIQFDYSFNLGIPQRNSLFCLFSTV